jgi:hypothetical protein
MPRGQDAFKQKRPEYGRFSIEGDDRNRTGVHGFAGTSVAFDLAL